MTLNVSQVFRLILFVVKIIVITTQILVSKLCPFRIVNFEGNMICYCFPSMSNPFTATDVLSTYRRFNQFNGYKTFYQYIKMFIKSRKK